MLEQANKKINKNTKKPTILIIALHNYAFSNISQFSGVAQLLSLAAAFYIIISTVMFISKDDGNYISTSEPSTHLSFHKLRKQDRTLHGALD